MDRTNNSIQIKEPCHENWNKMTASEKGRFCQSCQKEVVDFTKSSRDEILEHLSSASDSTCGRLYAHQLDEQPVECNTTSPTKSKFIYKLRSVGLSIMAFLGFSLVTENDANAQIVGRMPINGGLSYKDDVHNTNNEKTVITGTVKESHSQTGIAGANVTIESGGKMIADAFTDQQGRYVITVPAGKIVHNKFDITAYADEFEPVVMREMPVTKANITCNLNMEWGVMIMGDIAEPIEEIYEIQEIPQDETPQEEANLEENVEEHPIFKGQMIVNAIPEAEIRESEKELEAEALEQPTNLIAGLISCLPPTPQEDEVEDEINPPLAVEVEETEVKEIEEEEPIEPEPEEAEETTAATSIEDNTSTAMIATVYPNPTTDECKIELAKAGSYKIEVFDNAGRHVASEEFDGSKLNLDVSAFERGVYHIRIMGTRDNYAQTLELIVQ